MSDEKPKKKRPTKRGQGEGSVRQRKDGRWEARASAGRLDGKRRRPTIGYAKTQKGAWALVHRYHAEHPGRLAIDAETITLGQYVEQWLRDARSLGHHKATTHYRYASLVRRWIVPRLGAIRLGRVTPDHVQAFYTWLGEQGASGGDRRQCHSILHRSLKVAVRARKIPINPASADYVSRPKVEPAEVRAWTADEASRFLAVALDHRLGALFVLALLCGLRRGELFGLRWPRVVLDPGERRGRTIVRPASGSVRIERTIVSVGGRNADETPKSKRSKRVVTLAPFAVQVMLRHRERQREAGHYSEEGLVFTAAKGGELQPSNFRRELLALIAKAGVPHVSMHSTRHTSAFLDLEAGATLAEVSRRLGHASEAVTLLVYGAHVSPGRAAESAERMERTLLPSGGGRAGVGRPVPARGTRRKVKTKRGVGQTRRRRTGE